MPSLPRLANGNSHPFASNTGAVPIVEFKRRGHEIEGPKIDDGKPAGESRIPDLCGAPVTSTWLDVVLLSRSAAAQLGTFF